MTISSCAELAAGATLALVTVLASAAEDQPNDSLRTAEVRYRNGQFAEVVTLVSDAIRLDAKNVLAYRLRAAALEKLGQFDRAIKDVDAWLKLEPDTPGAYQFRGELHFKAGHINKSIADFDRFLKAHPDQMPHHWQRGISFYYAGEFKKGVHQFEIHKTVNPQDVENAIWHFLCKARANDSASARKGLIEIASDRRPWAMPVYQMYLGELTPQQLLKRVAQLSTREAEQRNNLFYTHLYIGLYYDASRKLEDAHKHIKIAAEEYPSSHYMGDVARVHMLLAKKK